MYRLDLSCLAHGFGWVTVSQFWERGGMRCWSCETRWNAPSWASGTVAGLQQEAKGDAVIIVNLSVPLACCWWTGGYERKNFVSLIIFFRIYESC